MAMKVTFYYSTFRQGATEVLIDLSSSTFTAALVNARALMAARIQTLGYNASGDAIRVTTVPDPGVIPPTFRPRSIVYSPTPAGDAQGGTIIPVFGPSVPPTNPTNFTGNPNDAVLVRCDGLNGGRKMLYVSFVPDTILGKDRTIDYNGVPGWAANWIAYKAILQDAAGPWGFRRLDHGGAFAPKSILDVTTRLTNPMLRGMVTDTSGTAPAVGTHVTIRRQRAATRGNSTYNGTWVVHSTVENYPAAGQRTIYLMNSEGVVPALPKYLGTVESVAYLYEKINRVADNGTATHKRGKPFGQRRGRSLSRAG